MDRFESTLMVKEVHEITETLIKIRAGRMTSELFSGLNFDDHHIKSHNYADRGMNDDYYDDYGMDDYGDDNYDME